jgi:hypothetical protein
VLGDLSETQLHQLLNDDNFVHAQYLPSTKPTLSKAASAPVLGMKVQASTLVPNGTAYAIDTRVASAMLLRRDVTVEDWEDAKTGKYGIRATTTVRLRGSAFNSCCQNDQHQNNANINGYNNAAIFPLFLELIE